MKKRVTITLDDKVVKQAKIKAIDNDTNLSATIEKLLVKYIESAEEKKHLAKKEDWVISADIEN